MQLKLVKFTFKQINIFQSIIYQNDLIQLTDFKKMLSRFLLL